MYDITYEDALLTVRTSPNIYHAGLSGYVIFKGTPTDYERKCVALLVDLHGYSVIDNHSKF